MEYGLFSDEGLIEDGFYSYEEAEKALARYSPEDNLKIQEICPEHPEEAKETCEFCNEEVENEL